MSGHACIHANSELAHCGYTQATQATSPPVLPTATECQHHQVDAFITAALGMAIQCSSDEH